jgi:DNA-binding protein H-NS
MEYKELHEILTAEQIKELRETVKELRKKKIAPLDQEFTKALREIFGKYREELLSKGIDSDYLAYAVSFVLSKLPEDIWEQTLKISEEKAKKKLEGAV